MFDAQALIVADNALFFAPPIFFLACCPDNQWGPECQPCPGDADRPCFGRGKCDGEGTRKGTGKCKCDKGYQGNLCRKCSTNYFASLQNETHITCDNFKYY
uniref:EGF-like domain-containing protein n=1 Tax=Romanomermis culicivorax TaxID=13658 RepID=A0A915JUS3_ROMCU